MFNYLSSFYKKHRVLSISILTLVFLIAAISAIGRIIIQKNSSYRMYLLEQGELSNGQVISYLHEVAIIKNPEAADNQLLSNLLTECKRRNIQIAKNDLILLLSHPVQAIRYQAVLHLGAQSDLKNVSSLIQALDVPFGLQHEIILLLRKTTGEELPYDPQVWKEWYKNLPETSEFKQMQYLTISK